MRRRSMLERAMLGQMRMLGQPPESYYAQPASARLPEPIHPLVMAGPVQPIHAFIWSMPKPVRAMTKEEYEHEVYLHQLMNPGPRPEIVVSPASLPSLPEQAARQDVPLLSTIRSPTRASGGHISDAELAVGRTLRDYRLSVEQAAEGVIALDGEVKSIKRLAEGVGKKSVDNPAAQARIAEMQVDLDNILAAVSVGAQFVSTGLEKLNSSAAELRADFRITGIEPEHLPVANGLRLEAQQRVRELNGLKMELSKSYEIIRGMQSVSGVYGL
jgi:hypothetical protein